MVLYVGSQSGCVDREATVVERLEDCAAAGSIDDLSVRLWPRRLSLHRSGGARTRFIDEYRQFAAWSASHDVVIHPPFVVEAHDSSFVEDADVVLHAPTLFVAVYRTDELVGLYPSSRPEGPVTLEAWIETIDDDAPERAVGRESVLVERGGSGTDEETGERSHRFGRRRRRPPTAVASRRG